MKKAIKINIGGLIFHIDEDAYDVLKNYLTDLGTHFGNGSEAKEIVSDVESRIAELFQTKMNSGKQVINFSDVSEVIAILGKPSDFGVKDDNDQANESNYGPENFSKPVKKRFYRDIDNSVIGGVCSGLSAYLNIDPVILRIIFVVLIFTGGASIPIYLILWIAIPAAITAAQKLEMRGEDINISTIEKTIKDEKETENRPFSGGRFHDFMNDVFSAFGRIFKAFFKVFGVFVGVILTIIGIALITAFIALSFVHQCNYGDSSFYLNLIPSFFSQFYNPEWFVWFFALIAIIAAIPILGILYLGLKLIFRFKVNDRYFWMAALAAWIISIILFVVLALTGVQSISDEANNTSEMQINSTPNATLYLQKHEILSDSAECKLFLKTDKSTNYYISKSHQIYGTPSLSIIKSSTSKAYLEITKESRGRSLENANQNLTHIVYTVLQTDSVLKLDSHFKLLDNNKWRLQEISMVLALPVGTRIFVDQNMKELLNYSNFWPDSYSGNFCIMEENGLKVIGK
jgi:phage shock protein PspC (stress-responsive transcriptional regulator)